MKNKKLINVILFGLCAVIWIIRVITGVVYKEYENSLWIFITNAVCAVIWVCTFIIYLVRYRSDNDEK